MCQKVAARLNTRQGVLQRVRIPRAFSDLRMKIERRGDRVFFWRCVFGPESCMRFFLSFLCLLWCWSPAVAADFPNIVVIYVDDLNIETGNWPSVTLYDLSSDPGELKNVAEQNETKVLEMVTLLQRIRQQGTPR